MRFLLILGLASLFPASDAAAQSPQGLNIHAGIRLQKTVGFYAMNGIASEIQSPSLLNGNVTFGLNFLSSKMGSAFFLNHGIPAHELQIGALHYFRPEKSFKPMLRLNTGYAWANYGSEIFSAIPHSSLLLALEPGIAYDFKKPVRLTASFGYNLISGSGDAGYGMLWPLYVQFSGLYRFSLEGK
jgi:hypothetical protein